VARADLTDPASWPAALAAVRKVFLYAHPEGAPEFAAAARKAGVEHVVLLSSSTVLYLDAAASPIALRHLAAERALDEAGLDRTFVRPGYYATNALRWWQSIRTGRVLRTAFPEAVRYISGYGPTSPRSDRSGDRRPRKRPETQEEAATRLIAGKDHAGRPPASSPAK
jgi:uncharacterized protein YbjT (DUF2867 family)